MGTSLLGSRGWQDSYLRLGFSPNPSSIGRASRVGILRNPGLVGVLLLLYNCRSVYNHDTTLRQRGGRPGIIESA